MALPKSMVMRISDKQQVLTLEMMLCASILDGESGSVEGI